MSTQQGIFSIKKTLAASLMMMMWILILLFSVVQPGLAEGSNVSSGGNTPATPQQGPTDPAELQAFLDQLLGKEMKEQHIAGAAVSVVKDGKLFFSKGYGYADMAKGVPVDPEQTIFPVGSISKLFTWTAVMQLVEQRKLDLDADINTYLDFRIPETYPQRITLKHLLTHTPGFEERLFEFDALQATDLVPSGKWLASHIPARVRPAGEIAAYSNYGAALAGYIVERVSAQSYDRYSQEHILGPLGMSYTTAQTPLPSELRAHASVGYTYVDGKFQAFPEYMAQLAIVPAGGIQASADDIARFMIAHLQGGRYSDASIADARILKETTAGQMHNTLYTADPRLPGTAYGFFDFSDNGQRTLGHSGGAHPFYTLLLLLPGQHLGVFVAYNGEAGDALTLQHLGFQRAFFDHYFPAPAVKPMQPPKDFAGRAGQFVGTYRVMEGSYTSFEKVMVLMGSTVEIANPRDGTLLLKTPWGDWRFVEASPLYFRSVDGAFSILFREDHHGHITHLFTGITPMFGFEKLNWYETPGFNMALLLACLLLFLSMIVLASVRAFRNRRSGDRKPEPRTARVARWIILAISILDLLFLAGTVLWGNPAPLFGISMIYKVVLGLGVLSALLTAGSLLHVVLAWKKSFWGIAGRVHYTLVTVAALAFVWFLNYWNLLGWRF